MIEKELINRLKKKDRQAQKYLFDKYSGLFYAMCKRYASNSDEANDILQEGFIKIYFNIDKFSGKGSFEGWLKRIIINNAINYYHKYLKYRYHDDVAENNYLESNDNFYDEKTFTYDELLKIINELPVGYRTIFNLYAIEGYKHKEIAELLKISENTSKSQYHRAKKILQEKLTQLKKQRDEI